jgi:hypothetical protein
MANTIQIKHGSSVPNSSNLTTFELGYSTNASASGLYIKTTASADPTLLAVPGAGLPTVYYCTLGTTWTSNTQTVTISGLNNSKPLIVGLADTANSTEYAECARAGLAAMASTSATNALVFTAHITTPTISLPIMITAL